MAWGFRNRLLLGVGVAVGISALAQLGLGYWVLLRAAEATVQRELLVFSPSDQGLQRFYGQVTFSDGQALLVGGVPLLGSSPWIALLVPGMAVEVEGSWEGAGFRLLELRIVAPARFSYCR